jgi:pyruvate/2-oxoglutarate dehydrogenase complex dihydrolipoamide dehydrogenase (E3) component
MKEIVKILPEDVHNRELISQVHPKDWKNPEPASIYNLVVVGAGTAGLVAALGGASLGARVALVERYLLGGDCLNFGCVPSKAIIRSSRVIGEVWESKDRGINIIDDSVNVDFALVMERMRRLRAQIGHHDSVARMKSQGIDVFLGDPRFRDRHSLEVDGKILSFKKAVIATGGRPVHPPIPGISDAGFLTNETVFSLTERPETLAVIGGGPIGCELAQAFHRLGSNVTIIQRNAQFLPREDRNAAEHIGKVFEREGIRCLLNADVKNVTLNEGKKVLYLTAGGKDEKIEADEILVGVGRIPNVEDLDLDAAGVEYDGQGVKINAFLQTSNRHIYAAGDVCLDYKFTHMAEAAARIVVQNALFIRSKKVSSLIVPWCTFTDPEIAHVGMFEKDVETKGIPVDTFLIPFKDVDRAILDGEEEGFVKIIVKKGKDKILGATVVARHAGEMINEITLSMVSGKGLKTLIHVIHPYPTQGNAFNKVCGLYYAKKFSPFLQRVLKRWFAWKR